MEEEAEIQKKLEGHLGPLVMNLVAKGPHPIPPQSILVPSSWEFDLGSREMVEGRAKTGWWDMPSARSNDP